MKHNRRNRKTVSILLLIFSLFLALLISILASPEPKQVQADVPVAGYIQSQDKIRYIEPVPDDFVSSIEEQIAESAAEEATIVVPETEESDKDKETDTDNDTDSYYVNLTKDEKHQLACLLYLEGRGESLECQYAICSVVINRFTTGDYDSILDVIYAKNQFQPARFISSTTPTKTQTDIVEEVCKEGPTIPEYVTYFRASYYHNWSGLVDYKAIDNTYFSYSTKLYNKYN